MQGSLRMSRSYKNNGISGYESNESASMILAWMTANK